MFLNLTFHTLAEARDWLNQYELASHFPFERRKVWRMKAASLTLKCKYCPAVIGFRECANRPLVNVRFINRHLHQNTSLNDKRQKIIDALHCVDEFRAYYTKQEMFYFIKAKFLLSKKETKNVFRIDWMRNPLKYTMEKLWVLDYDYRHYQGDEAANMMPEVLVFLSENMLTFNRKWGDVVYLEFLYDVVPAKPGRHSSISLGIFTGVAPNQSQLLLGVCLLTKSSKNNYIRVLRAYLEMNGTYPMTIVTQDVREVAEAVAELHMSNELPGNHLIDTNCVLRRISASGESEPLALYEKLMESQNEVSFEKNLQILRDRCGNAELFEDFISEAQKTCYSHTSPVFVGFTMRMARNPVLRFLNKDGKFRDVAVLLDSLVQIEKESMLGFQTNLLTRKSYETLFGEPRLKDVREKLPSGVFQQFLAKYTAGLKCTLANQQTHFEVTDMDAEVFKIAPDSEDKLRCHCDYQARAGIPCEHLMCVVAKHPDIDIMLYVNRRWVLEQGFARVMVRDGSQIKLMTEEL